MYWGDSIEDGFQSARDEPSRKPGEFPKTVATPEGVEPPTLRSEV
jgi:hypothetical protein